MLTVCFGRPLAGRCQWYRDNGTVTSCPDICPSAFRFHLSHILATLEFRVRKHAPHQFSRVFSRGLTLTLHIITTPIYVFLCFCSLSDSSEHLARSIFFHTLLCNGRGRKCIKKPQAKRLKVNINTFPCLSLVCFEVIMRTVCTLLDIQGRVNACSL